MKLYNIILTSLVATMDTIVDLYKKPTVENYHSVCRYLVDTVEKDWGLDTKPLETRLYTIGGVNSIETRITIIYPSLGGGYREMSLRVWLNDEEIEWDLVP